MSAPACSLSRKLIKAIHAKGGKVPVDQRRATYRAEVVTHCRWKMTPEEEAFSADLVARLPTDCQFFHGGQAGLATGAHLLPASVTGKDPQGAGNLFPERLAFCYITTSLIEAAIYAARAGNGVVYQVQPEGLPQMDPEAIRTVQVMLRDPAMIAHFGPAEIVEMETAYRCKSARICQPVFQASGNARETVSRLGVVMGGHPQFVGPNGWFDAETLSGMTERTPGS